MSIESISAGPQPHTIGSTGIDFMSGPKVGITFQMNYTTFLLLILEQLFS